MIDVVRLLSVLQIDTKRQGSRLWARCPSPDHEDHDPSWYIWDCSEDSDRHGRHRCFGCGFGGGAAALVAIRFECSVAEARAWLKAGELDAPILSVSVEIRSSFRRAFRLPRGVIFRPFAEWPSLAMRYAMSRGLTAEIVDRWGIGYAVDGELLGRLVIPVRDSDGIVQSYQARSMIGRDPKYLTPVGVRSGAMLGVEFWPEVPERSIVVLVEGPLDAIAVDRAVGLPVAGLLGSQPSPEQMARLATFPRVVVLTDPDAAGQRAARAIEGLSRWSTIQRVSMPDGTDPASVGDLALRSLLQSDRAIGGDLSASDPSR